MKIGITKKDIKKIISESETKTSLRFLGSVLFKIVTQNHNSIRNSQNWHYLFQLKPIKNMAKFETHDSKVLLIYITCSNQVSVHISQKPHQFPNWCTNLKYLIIKSS